MKAITLWQPWASLWLTPAKVHETRPWKTSYRGELAVHAAKRPIDWYLPIELRGLCIDHFGREYRDTLPLGAIIGVVQLVDCYSSNDHDPAHWEDARCGDFSAGRYLWKRGLVLTLAKPLPAVGRQRPLEWTRDHLGGEIYVMDMVIAVDVGREGGDCTAVAGMCPVCRTLYLATLEPGEEVVAVGRCEVCFPANDTEGKAGA